MRDLIGDHTKDVHENTSNKSFGFCFCRGQGVWLGGVLHLERSGLPCWRCLAPAQATQPQEAWAPGVLAGPAAAPAQGEQHCSEASRRATRTRTGGSEASRRRAARQEAAGADGADGRGRDGSGFAPSVVF